MKEVQGWTEEGDELALLVGKQHYKKHLKDNVDIVANMDTKQLIVIKERQT